MQRKLCVSTPLENTIAHSEVGIFQSTLQFENREPAARRVRLTLFRFKLSEPGLRRDSLEPVSFR